MGAMQLFSRLAATGALYASLWGAMELRAETKTNEVNIAGRLMRASPLIQRQGGWKEFLDERIDYNLSRRFTTKSYVEIFSERDLHRTLPSELGARQLRNVVRHSAVQTLREELIERSALDDWLDEHVAGPIVDFIGDRILKPVVHAVSSFRKNSHGKEGEIRYRKGIVQDLFGGRVEQNQLINPLTDKGIPGEEQYRPLRLPNSTAFGARLGSSPYLYATAPLGDWYAQARFGAAELLERPRLDSASLAFLTELSPHALTLSFGGRMPFKDEREPEQYFGAHGFVGLSRIIKNGNGMYREAYVELLAGEHQFVFLGLRQWH